MLQHSNNPKYLGYLQLNSWDIGNITFQDEVESLKIVTKRLRGDNADNEAIYWTHRLQFLNLIVLYR